MTEGESTTTLVCVEVRLTQVSVAGSLPGGGHCLLQHGHLRRLGVGEEGDEGVPREDRDASRIRRAGGCGTEGTQGMKGADPLFLPLAQSACRVGASG